MKSGSKPLAVALASGLLFGAGLVVSGMTTPAKIIGFLDVSRKWDPSLIMVMVGAIAVHFLAYRLVKRRSSPLFETKFAIPTRRDIDFKLVAGAALFGAGWGLGGFCPGPGLVSSASGATTGLVFLSTMLLAMFATAKAEAAFAKARSARAEPVAGGAAEPSLAR